MATDKANDDRQSMQAQDGSGTHQGGNGWLADHKAAWIGAVAAVVAALIGLLGTVLGNQHDDGSSAADSRPSASTTSAAATSPAIGERSPSANTGPADVQESGGVQWQGVLALDDQPAGNKDLDTTQPVSSGNPLDDKTDLYGYFGEIRARNNAKASLWTGSDLPDYADCVSTVDSAGAEAQRVKVGTVLCIRTSEGRVGRLKATAADGSTTSMQFEGIVWGRAAH
ncbi:hypothetical protein [Streptomyces sp. NRRL S-337]|uniref:hypothetical protein n=1 Tax=Streptomyces sp. NRRL S-337 TaxID=1463900 RepID=UPI0004CC1847|nr:hypothetical protein [Streptomyces sp. NRRL S-337]